MDPKSIGLCPQGFESPRCRQGTAATPRVIPVQKMTQLLCSCRRVVGQANSKTSTAQVPSQTPLALHGPQLLKCGQPMARLVTLGGSHSSTPDRVHPAHDNVSERPRRWTRNPLGSARMGFESPRCRSHCSALPQQSSSATVALDYIISAAASALEDSHAKSGQRDRVVKVMD